MEWVLEWGKFEKDLIKSAEAGEVLPALERKPDISGSEWLWNAYAELGTCRSIGMDVGPIPWTARQKYVEVHGFNKYEQDLLAHCISVLDEIQRDKRKEK